MISLNESLTMFSMVRLWEGEGGGGRWWVSPGAIHFYATN